MTNATTERGHADDDRPGHLAQRRRRRRGDATSRSPASPTARCYQNDGTTPINNGDFITFAQGNAGLKFTPATNSILTGHFTVQASIGSTESGLGGATVTADISIGGPVQCFTGASATGSGNITACFTGGGPTCGYTRSEYIPLPPDAVPLPSASFPHGLFSFAAANCTPGSVVSFTIVYPQPLPPGTNYWKFGVTPGNNVRHWYALPATISGNTVTFSITDGDLGDSDLTANGVIDDPGGPGVPLPVVRPSAIPTLGEWALALLAMLLLGFGVRSAGRRRRPER